MTDPLKQAEAKLVQARLNADRAVNLVKQLEKDLRELEKRLRAEK